MDIKPYVRELLSLVNKPGLTKDNILRMKDIICFLSEYRSKNIDIAEEIPSIDVVLEAASKKLRVFGYNRMNGYDKNTTESDVISLLKDDCINEYYKTSTGYILDKAQKQILDSFEYNNQRLFLSAPTSFGKTFLLKEILYNHCHEYNNIVIVLPTVALLMEVTEDLSSFFDTHKLNYKFHNSIYKDLVLSDKNIFILTPERVLRLLAIKPDIIIDFFFFDEIYKIDEDISVDVDSDNDDSNNKKAINKKDNHRAIAFRLSLYLLLKKTSKCYIAGPFIKLNAIKTGFSKLLSSYGIASEEIDFEPTLKNRILYEGKTIKFSSPFEQYQINTSESSKSDKLKNVLQELNTNTDQPAIVFCLYPSYTEKYARDFCEKLPISENEDIDIFMEHITKNYSFRLGDSEQFSIDYWNFLYSLSHGIGIHNGKFPKYFQKEIIELFNRKTMPVLFCTSTIVEGVNTNAKTVVIYNNPQNENEAGKRFMLLNINGRAGRYLRHFVGNVVYLDNKTKAIESAKNIQLDFKIFSDEAILSDLDLENVEDSDISQRNLDKKNAIKLDKELLPDEIFIQNRLIERRKQEKILNLIRKRLHVFYGIESVGINSFIQGNYFEEILKIWAEVGEITNEQVNFIKYFSKRYADQGYPGVFKYEFDRYNSDFSNSEKDNKYINDIYRKVFRTVKDTIEYQLPRILTLFETLIGRAFEIENYKLLCPLDLSNIIRYFEIGAKTPLGIDMIEKGIPIITVRKIEKQVFKSSTLEEQQIEFKERWKKIFFDFDRFETKLINKYFKWL